MDSQPSDQLTGNSGSWHTVSVVLGPDHQYLSEFTAKLLPKPAQRTLGVAKWNDPAIRDKKRRAAYKNSFVAALREKLPNSRLSIFSASSTEEQICRVANRFYIENAVNIDRFRDGKGRECCRFYFDRGEKPVFVDIDNRRGAVLLWMATVIHYLTEEFIEQKFGRIEKLVLHSDWIALDDPGPPIRASGATLLATVVSRITQSKVELRLSKKAKDNREILADNLAGWANEYAANHQKSPTELTRAFDATLEGSPDGVHFEWITFDGHIQIIGLSSNVVA